MTRRLNGTSRKDSYPRDPFGWYVEPEFSVEQLFDCVDFANDLIWDPSCGRGTILDVARRRGHQTYGSDIVDRFKPGGHPFTRMNFLQCRAAPRGGGRPLSIINNPPFNEPEPGIAEKFVQRALKLGGWHRAFFLVPVEFQCGQGRYDRLYSRHTPSHVISLMERPDCPPGHLVEAGAVNLGKGGMADFVWVGWTQGWTGPTIHLFAKPSNSVSHDISTRRVRAGRNVASASAT